MVGRDGVDAYHEWLACLLWDEWSVWGDCVRKIQVVSALEHSCLWWWWDVNQLVIIVVWEVKRIFRSAMRVLQPHPGGTGQ